MKSLVTAADLERQIETDGSLAPADATLAAGKAIAAAVWGQGFPEPKFFDGFDVVEQRIVGGRHMKLRIAREGRAFDAILFGATDAFPARIEAVYRLDINEFNGAEALQLTVQHWRPA